MNNKIKLNKKGSLMIDKIRIRKQLKIRKVEILIIKDFVIN